MTKPADDREHQILKNELMEIVYSLNLNELFKKTPKDDKYLHRNYGGLLVSASISRMLQSKLKQGLRLSWGQILSTDGQRISNEMDLMVCTGVPARIWDVIGYSIERQENVHAVFEVKHSMVDAGSIGDWARTTETFLPPAGSSGAPSIGVIVLWDESSKTSTQFKNAEQNLAKELPTLGEKRKSAFVLSGGPFDPKQRELNIPAWARLTRHISSYTPTSYFFQRGAEFLEYD